MGSNGSARQGPLDAEAVLDHIEPHADIIVPLANGEPVALLDALENNHEQLESVPSNCSEMPKLLRDSTNCSIVLAAASPPDRTRANKLVATFCLGTQKLYDWLHDNGSVELLPVDYVNDPRMIGREDDLMSINATTEVDLFGQCASETIAGRYWSSSGGQADFARGAMYSREGSVVTTIKNTVDHVVTEWGVAELRGKSVADRARALMGIAHPDHRDALEAEAREAGLIPKRP